MVMWMPSRYEDPKAPAVRILSEKVLTVQLNGGCEARGVPVRQLFDMSIELMTARPRLKANHALALALKKRLDTVVPVADLRAAVDAAFPELRSLRATSADVDTLRKLAAPQ